MWQYPQTAISGVAVPTDSNIVQKEAEKKLKRVHIEIQQMWYLKSKIIPGIIRATRIATKGLRKNLEAIPRKHSVDSLQKTAILGTSHTVQKVLQSESLSLSGGDHCWFKRSTMEKKPVARDNNNKQQCSSSSSCIT